MLAADAGLGDVLVGELGAGAGDLVEHLSDEVLEIEDLHALVPQDLGEGVVLLLRDLQERDVVEQESLELVGRQVEELVAGTVQADLPELADLGRHVQTFRHGLLPFFRALLAECISAPPYGTLLADSSSYIQIPFVMLPRPRTVSKVR